MAKPAATHGTLAAEADNDNHHWATTAAQALFVGPAMSHIYPEHHHSPRTRQITELADLGATPPQVAAGEL